MRRLVLFLLVAGALSAQTTIQNNEEYLAYYAGTQFSETAVREALLAPGGGVEFLGNYLSAERYLPPLGALVDETLGSRTRTVVGVFVRPESTRYPVFLVPGDRDFLSVGEEDILRRADGRAMTISPLDLRVQAERIVIDNRYLDWETIPDLLRSGPATTPRRARRITDAREETLPLGETLYWRKGGTELEGLKIALTDTSLYFGFDASRPMVEGLSLFAYIYPGRPRGVAAITVEIPVAEPTGPILVWRRGVDDPVVAGYFTVADFFLEGRVFREALGRPEDIDEVSIDISTAFFGPGVFEEFEYGTVYLREAAKF
jgi:hypothetical protein